MADDGVWARRDEAVVLSDADVECEEPFHGAVAVHPEEGPEPDERYACDREWGEAEILGAPTAHERGQDGTRNRQCGTFVCHDDGYFCDAEEPEYALHRLHFSV